MDSCKELTTEADSDDRDIGFGSVVEQTHLVPDPGDRVVEGGEL